MKHKAKLNRSAEVRQSRKVLFSQRMQLLKAANESKDAMIQHVRSQQQYLLAFKAAQQSTQRSDRQRKAAATVKRLQQAEVERKMRILDRLSLI